MLCSVRHSSGTWPTEVSSTQKSWRRPSNGSATRWRPGENKKTMEALFGGFVGSSIQVPWVCPIRPPPTLAGFHGGIHVGPFCEFSLGAIAFNFLSPMCVRGQLKGGFNVGLMGVSMEVPFAGFVGSHGIPCGFPYKFLGCPPSSPPTLVRFHGCVHVGSLCGLYWSAIALNLLGPHVHFPGMCVKRIPSVYGLDTYHLI